MSGLSLPPIGKPSAAGPSGAGPKVPPSPSFIAGKGKSMSAGASVTSSAGARPSAALLLALWGLFVVGLLGVAFGVWSWSNNTFAWRLHIGAALLSFFATVVVLARLRLDLNRRRRSGGLIERPWTSIRTTTTVALLAWSFGIAHLALVGLELSSGLGG